MNRLALAGGVLAVAACDGPAPVSSPTPPAPPFTMTDVTAVSGIDFVTTSGIVPATQILEVKGAGLALIDYDTDGDLDLFVPNGATLGDPAHGPGARLFANEGRLRFRDVTREAGITFDGWGMGVAVGDLDGDGRDDLYITAYGPDRLLLNRGGRFEDVTAATGVTVDGWSTGCALGDLDQDGDLDVYVARYVDFDASAPPGPSSFRGQPVLAGPRGLPPQADVLLENLGGGRFRDATAAAGMNARPPAYGLGVVILDFDGDGRQDVFVGNDSMANFLYRNAGAADAPLRFDEVGVASGLASSGDGSARATMGLAVADVDDDGRPDLLSTNFAGEPNTLHLGRPGGFHDDATRRFGLGMSSYRYLGWACGFVDLDHDADEDLVIFNGHVYAAATPETMFSGYAQPPLLYAREGPRFVRVESGAGGTWLDTARCERTAVFGDLDGDGDVDLVTAGVNLPLRVLRNDDADGHWLIVAPRRPLGTRVEIADASGRRQRRWIASGTGYLSASAAVAHFGLADRGGPVDVTVTWPDGHVRTIPGVASDRRLDVER